MVTEQTTSQPMTAPADVLERFAAAWAARDGAAIGQLFVNDPEFVNVTGMWWHTPERIAMAHTFGFEKIFADSDLKFVESRVRMIGDNAAVVLGRWEVEGQTTGDGRRAGPRQGIFTFVMERDGDQWRAVAAHNTDVVVGHESVAVVDGASVPQSYDASPTKRGL